MEQHRETKEQLQEHYRVQRALRGEAGDMGGFFAPPASFGSRVIDGGSERGGSAGESCGEGGSGPWRLGSWRLEKPLLWGEDKLEGEEDTEGKDAWLQAQVGDWSRSEVLKRDGSRSGSPDWAEDPD